jgi:hypothetical protein
VRIADDDIVTLRLAKKIPDTYDERLGLRGLHQSDIKDYEFVNAINTDSTFTGNSARRFKPNEIMKTDESLLIQYFEKDGKNHVSPIQLVFNQEIPYDSFGRFRYTKVTFIARDTKDLVKRAVAAINKLITSYRINTNDFWVTPISEKDLECIEFSNRPTSYSPLVKFLPDISPTKVEQVKIEIKLRVLGIASHMLLLDARNAKEHMNYGLCIIYSVTSIESIVKTFLFFHTKNRGFSKDEQDRLNRMSISSLMHSVLTLIISKTDLSPEMRHAFTVINRIRNDIIHAAESAIEPKVAEDAVKLAEKFEQLFYAKIGEQINLIESNEKPQPQ